MGKQTNNVLTAARHWTDKAKKEKDDLSAKQGQYILDYSMAIKDRSKLILYF